MKKILVIVTVVVFCCLGCNVNQAQIERVADRNSEATPTAEPMGEPRPVPPTPFRPFDCALIQEESLRTLKFGELGQEEMRRWLEEESPFAGVNIETASNFLIWEHDKGVYEAQFRSGVLRSISVYRLYFGQTFPSPSAADVIACLGEPDLYQAVLTVDPGGLHVVFSLWYLEQGIVVSSGALYDYAEQLPSSMDEITMIDTSIVAPGTVEDVMRSVYNPGGDAVLATLRPWPGAWEDVEFTGCFDIRDCPY